MTGCLLLLSRSLSSEESKGHFIIGCEDGCCCKYLPRLSQHYQHHHHTHLCDIIYPVTTFSINKIELRKQTKPAPAKGWAHSKFKYSTIRRKEAFKEKKCYDDELSCHGQYLMCACVLSVCLCSISHVYRMCVQASTPQELRLFYESNRTLLPRLVHLWKTPTHRSASYRTRTGRLTGSSGWKCSNFVVEKHHHIRGACQKHIKHRPVYNPCSLNQTLVLLVT